MMTARFCTPSLALGTVQFGIPYGITNVAGQVSADEAGRIIDAAQLDRRDVVLDTAPGYGTSERVVGGYIARHPAQEIRLVSKTNLKNPDIEASVRDSLQCLQANSLYALLDHNATYLLGTDGAGAYRVLQGLKDKGLVQKIGASVYTGDDLDRLEKIGPVDVVQIPLNVFDQRLILSGHVARLKDRGVEIHVRSAFLQGLLLSDLAQLPAFISEESRALFRRYHAAVRDAGLSLLEAALAFQKAVAGVDEVVVGVTTHDEFSQIRAAFHLPVEALDWAGFSSADSLLLNPAKWPPRG